MKNALAVPGISSLPIGSLEAYIHHVNQIPLLSEEEEKDLSNRCYYQQDLEAARRLVLSHLRFVVSVARKYSGYGLAQADLIQEGNLGLMKAVRRFNPEMGVRLVSFAVHWVKAEIHEFILRNWKIVKVATTKAQRKLFFNLRKSLRQHVGWMSEEKTKEVSTQLNVSEKEVRLMEGRLSTQDEAFDLSEAPYVEGSILGKKEDQDNPAVSLEEEEWSDGLKETLNKALEKLDSRSYDIICRRWLLSKDQKTTLADLAKEYGVSLERVRQIEKAAMKKVKQLVAPTS
jgi:RNA polymerase sigma-32 factor